VSYWAGTDDLTRQIFQAALDRYHQFDQELEADIEFRETHLLLTIDTLTDPTKILADYQGFTIAPEWLTAQEAQEREPLLNSATIAGVLCFPHGHVSPTALTQAYRQAFQRYGGTIEIAQVEKLQHYQGRYQGVLTSVGNFSSAKVAICAGGLSRLLLHQSGLTVPLYFTQAELIEIEAPDLDLQTIVMSAIFRRPSLEAQASQPGVEALWDQPGHELFPAVLDAGAVQFRNKLVRLGQMSRVLTDPQAAVAATESETAIRAGVEAILPALAHRPGQWHQCLVAFSRSQLPLIGAIEPGQGVYLFSGFSSPFAFVPPLAQKFAQSFATEPDPWIQAISLSHSLFF
jgi:glycine/D-amino acid oxidase-like deaminating enzyme